MNLQERTEQMLLRLKVLNLHFNLSADGAHLARGHRVASMGWLCPIIS
jgi:hypothetical protein